MRGGARLADCQAQGRALLIRAARALGYPAPERVPLRLSVEEGCFRSALPRQLAGGREDPAALAEGLVRRLPEAGSCFSSPQAEGGMVLLPLSPQWQRETLEELAAGAWTPPPLEEGLGARDRGDPAFLLGYTLRRCRTLAGRAGETALPPVGLTCRLAFGSRGDTKAVLDRYWAMPPALRQCPLTAGAVGRTLAAWREETGDS